MFVGGEKPYLQARDVCALLRSMRAKALAAGCGEIEALEGITTTDFADCMQRASEVIRQCAQGLVVQGGKRAADRLWNKLSNEVVKNTETGRIEEYNLPELVAMFCDMYNEAGKFAPQVTEVSPSQSIVLLISGELTYSTIDSR